MRKKVILICVLLIILAIVAGAVIIMFNHNNSGNVGNTVSTNSTNSSKNESVSKSAKSDDDEIDLEQLYADYLEENILEEEDKVNGVYLDCNGDDYAELIIKHEKNTKLKVLYLDGDSIQESEDYENSNIALLYDVENEEPHYCILNDKNYILIEDIIGNKKVEKLSESDDEFKYLYVKCDITSNFYTISSDSTYDDVAKVKSKSKDLITDEIKDTALADIKEIKDSELTKTDTGISNNKYSISFGEYTYGEHTITINSDYSLRGVDKYNDKNVSYDIFHDTITIANKLSLYGIEVHSLTVIDNNTIQDQKGRTWNLKK